MNNVPCAGSGTEVTGVRLYHHGEGRSERLARCTTCGRVLTPSGRRKLGKHLMPGQTTAATDEKMQMLWAMTEPRSEDQLPS